MHDATPLAEAASCLQGVNAGDDLADHIADEQTQRDDDQHRDQGYTHTVPDEALRQLPACADACPSQALTFGNLLDPASVPASTRKSGRSYFPIAEINTYPAVNYLSRASYAVHRAEHGAEHDASAEAETTEAGHDAGGH